MHSMVTPGSQAEEVGRLILAGFIVIALPALPFGNFLVYPFTILTTWFHEMGHGMTALLMGQDFVRLQIFADGSGLAESRIAADASPFLRASIAAGGPLAPTFVGAGLILASAHPKMWRPALWGLSAAIFASVILYVRSSVGVAVLPLIALTLALIAWKASPGVNRFTLQFLGVLGAMSMLSDYRYFFTEEVVIDGRHIPFKGHVCKTLFVDDNFHLTIENILTGECGSRQNIAIFSIKIRDLVGNFFQGFEVGEIIQLLLIEKLEILFAKGRITL